jgi:type VI secretion system secreted protein VgrG
MPPYTLPDHRTQSGIKSRSANAGTPNNFNELRFEDLKGKEELHIQAERNMSTLVKHNQSLSVGGDRSVNVTGNETIDIKKKESLTVHEGRMEIIEKGDNLSVQASDKDIEVDGQYTTYSKNMYQVLQGPDNEILLDDSIVSVKNKSCTIKFDDTNATLTAADSITLQCGTAQIKLSKEGTITISGSLKVAVTGGKGSVTLDDSAATIAAPTIKLNS